MKLLIIALLTFGNTQANWKLARIVDKDGFTNVRSGPALAFEVVDTVSLAVFFYCEKSDIPDWAKVRLLKWRSGKPVSGYIHKSRIQIIEDVSNEDQKMIIRDVLDRHKLLADEFIKSHQRYNQRLMKWDSDDDSIRYVSARQSLEFDSETNYDAILIVLPKVFCATGDKQIMKSFFATVWSDRGSANEMPSFALGECFSCHPKLLSDLIVQLQDKDQKTSITDHIEWGLLNKFSVDENGVSSDPEFIKLKKQLDLLRK